MTSLLRVATILVLFSTYGWAAEPTLPSANDIRDRRGSIHRELDENVDAVRQCFEMLDTLPEGDQEARAFLDEQIRQYDDRSSVLHDELAEIDRYEALSQHHDELVQEVTRLKDEAAQLKKHGHQLPAQLRQAKANSIQKMLNDGTWKILADEEHRRESQHVNFVSVLQLNIEVESLRQDAADLRKEVKTLRETVEQLERLVREALAK